MTRITNMPPRPRILVVDDDTDIREIVVEILDAQGYEVEQATDGRDAFLSIRAQRFDLVVLDVCMPDIDGAEAIAMLRADGARVPRVLVFSALPAHEIRRLFGDDVRALSKSQGLDALIGAVRDAVGLA